MHSLPRPPPFFALILLFFFFVHKISPRTNGAAGAHSLLRNICTLSDTIPTFPWLLHVPPSYLQRERERREEREEREERGERRERERERERKAIKLVPNTSSLKLLPVNSRDWNALCVPHHQEIFQTIQFLIIDV